MKWPQKTRFFAIVSVAVLLIYCLNYFLTPCFVGVKRLESFFRPRGTEKFNSQTWKFASPFSGERYQMADDLIQSRILLHRDRADVETLLGKPDLIYEQEGETHYTYTLGGQRKIPVRSVWFPGWFANIDRWLLDIRFINGKVCGMKLYAT